MFRIANKSRGSGKTTRLLYASEFNGVPILCATPTHKTQLLEQAAKLNLPIPEPITVEDIVNGRYKGMVTHREIFCDELPQVFEILLQKVADLNLSDSTMCVPFMEVEPIDRTKV